MQKKQPPLSISLIGAGNLGKTLARLWNEHGLLSIKQVFTTRQSTADTAVEFIGAGEAKHKLSELETSDIVLIAVPDDQISTVCNTLQTSPERITNSIVFHCSGVLSSRSIKHLSDSGASVASVHPIKSFADTEAAIKSFRGTYCGVEGDKTALQLLTPLFTSLGAHILPINPDRKELYHCAAVFANNYLVSIIECAQELYRLSGIDRNQSMQLINPMLRETCSNLLEFGTRESLTGPIARGDLRTIEKHLAALEAIDQETLELYQALGRATVRLTERKGSIPNKKEILRRLR